MRPVLVACEAVTVARGRRKVLTGVDFELRAGQTLHLSGANGSGKTSLMRVLGGMARPRAGSVDRRVACAYVPEKVVLASALQPGEWLEAMCRIRGVARPDWVAAAVESGLDAEVLVTRASALSKGMLQRVALIEALHSGSPLLLLDEPFAGLDAPGRDWLAASIVRRVGRDGGVILTDHSGAAGTRLAHAGELVLTEGRCAPAWSGRAPTALMRITATDRTGVRITREVDAAAVDAVLLELLAAGGHIEDVRRC